MSKSIQGPVTAQLLAAVPAAEHPGLDDGVVHLVGVGASRCPDGVGGRERIKVWLEIGERGELFCFIPEMLLPVLNYFDFYFVFECDF